jgi:hypothetical protein
MKKKIKKSQQNISQSEYNEYNVIIIRYFVLTLIRHLYEEEKNQHAYSDGR